MIVKEEGMNITELGIATGNANTLFKKIKEKYPNLAGYLVYSSPYGQCNLTTDLFEISKAFPAMIVDSKQKEKAVALVQSIVSMEKEKKDNVNAKETVTEKIKQLKNDFLQMLDKVELRDDTFVEIRFDEKKANLSLIDELRKDELVSREHTPQTMASIRIVLGTLRDLQ
ncbi:MAG TPA: hypothetical protein PLQ69_04410 [Paludibacter sp.]|jgi:predicted Zn-dependent peptidase|nr:hypothetical protein [Paludibacter sp.]